MRVHSLYILIKIYIYIYTYILLNSGNVVKTNDTIGIYPAANEKSNERQSNKSRVENGVPVSTELTHIIRNDTIV